MQSYRRAANLRWGIIPVLALAASATGLQAQGPWSEESPLADAVREILVRYRQLAGDQAAPGEEVQLQGSGQRGLVGGLFREGESKSIEFDVTAASCYTVAGAGKAVATDLDLCIYDDDGRRVHCGRKSDAIPILSSTAASNGTDRAVANPRDHPAHAGLVIAKKSTGVGAK